MDRVDVVAQPHARVGDPRARRARVLGERGGQRAGVGGRDRLLQAEEARRLGLQPRVDPARDEPVVVVAGRHHQLAAGPERLAQLGEHRPRELGDVALGPVAQLDAVAEDHEPVGAPDGLHQRRPQVGPAQQVGAPWRSRCAGRRRRACARRFTLECRPVAPLDGILVADFSRVLAGPVATMLLGDLGADVIKVERPDTGDDTRAWGPPWHGDEQHLLPHGSTATSARWCSTSPTRATASWRARSRCAPTCSWSPSAPG